MLYSPQRHGDRRDSILVLSDREMPIGQKKLSPSGGFLQLEAPKSEIRSSFINSEFLKAEGR